MYTPPQYYCIYIVIKQIRRISYPRCGQNTNEGTYSGFKIITIAETSAWTCSYFVVSVLEILSIDVLIKLFIQKVFTYIGPQGQPPPTFW